MLEIASGSGEHAMFLAPRLGVSSWQPTDPDHEARASIDAWRVSCGASVVLPALALDVTSRPWPNAVTPNVVVCINMIHIAPWSACEALLDSAAELLEADGLLYLYGPYRRGGAHTSPSNEAFDASLRRQHPEWGVRDLDDVAREALARGLDLVDVLEMPANNLSVIFRPALNRSPLSGPTRPAMLDT